MSLLDLKEACKVCLGRKKIMSTGILFKVCPNCGGCGYTDIKKQTPEDKLLFPEKKTRVYNKKAKVKPVIELIEKKAFSTDDNVLINGTK